MTPKIDVRNLISSSNSLHLVMSGRIRITQSSSDNSAVPSTVAEEIGPGHTLGRFGLITTNPRIGTARAIRACKVVQVQAVSLTGLSFSFPYFAFCFSQVIGRDASSFHPKKSLDMAKQKPTSHSTVKTIAIIGLSEQVPVNEFASQLEAAVTDLGLQGDEKLVLLSSSSIVLDGEARSANHKYGESMLENYLAQLEENSGLLLFLATCSDEVSWVRTCVSHVSVLFVPIGPRY